MTSPFAFTCPSCHTAIQTPWDHRAGCRYERTAVGRALGETGNPKLDQPPRSEPVQPAFPNPPAPGRNGRWVRLGDVGVDSASIAITDLVNRETTDATCKPNDPDARHAEKNSPWAGDWGTGIRFWAGFGDGGYDIWAWVVDYGEGDEVDERIAQVVITMIDQDELDDWRNN